MTTEQLSRNKADSAAAARWRFTSAGQWARSTFARRSAAPADEALGEPLAQLPVRKDRFAVTIDDGRERHWLSTAAMLAWLCAGRGWLISAGVHGFALVGLALLMIPALGPPDGVFLSGQAPSANDDSLDRQPLVVVAAPMASDAHRVFPNDAATDLASRPEVRPLPLERLVDHSDRRRGPLDDVLDLPLTSSAADQKVVVPRLSGAAEFFGVQAAGSRFVFVVDCSYSMAGPKWRIACQELADAIDRLDEDQFFYVIFFDGASHPMFGQSIRYSALEQATSENIDRLKEWLQTVRLGYNTSPCVSVKHAVQLRPDAVFLLSDGDFNDPTAAYLRKRNRDDAATRVAVHTLCFQSRKGERILRRIAQENGGTYRFVP